MAQTCVNAPIVTEVYPRASELPENLLRFYIYFDQPMKTKVEPNAVRLIDENGTIVKDTFLTHKVDLWSQDKQRLTVLFDPGRVKTGLQAHHQLGRALKKGHRYRLEIDTSFIGVSGCHLAAVYSKDFDVAGPDKQIPDPDHWTITTPKAGTTDKINIALNGVYDHVSLAYRIRIKDKKGQVVPGYIEISDDDSDWMFKPDQPWRFETYFDRHRSYA